VAEGLGRCSAECRPVRRPAPAEDRDQWHKLGYAIGKRIRDWSKGGLQIEDGSLYPNKMIRAIQYVVATYFPPKQVGP
jgi:hypothetical protein